MHSGKDRNLFRWLESEIQRNMGFVASCTRSSSQSLGLGVAGQRVYKCGGFGLGSVQSMKLVLEAQKFRSSLPVSLGQAMRSPNSTMGPAIPVTAAIMRPVGVRSKTATAVMAWRQILFSPALRRFADLLFLRMGSAFLTQPHIGIQTCRRRRFHKCEEPFTRNEFA